MLSARLVDWPTTHRSMHKNKIKLCAPKLFSGFFLFFFILTQFIKERSKIRRIIYNSSGSSERPEVGDTEWHVPSVHRGESHRAASR